MGGLNPEVLLYAGCSTLLSGWSGPVVVDLPKLEVKGHGVWCSDEGLLCIEQQVLHPNRADIDSFAIDLVKPECRDQALRWLVGQLGMSAEVGSGRFYLHLGHWVLETGWSHSPEHCWRWYPRACDHYRMNMGRAGHVLFHALSGVKVADERRTHEGVRLVELEVLRMVVLHTMGVL